MKIRTRNLITLAVAALATIGTFATANAQADAVLDKVIPSAEYQQADVRETLKTLFRQVDVNYSIQPEIQGLVTVSMKNARFGLLLQSILDQVGASWRYEGGAFIIFPKPIENTNNAGGGDTQLPDNSKSGKVTARIPLNKIDPQLLAMLIGQTGQNFFTSPEPVSLSRVGQGGGGMMGGMGGGMMGGMGGGGMMGGMGGGMMGGMGGGMGGGMMGGMGGGMMGGMGGGGMMGGGMGGGGF